MAEPRWRTGRKVGRTVYLDGKLVGLMDTAELAEFFVSLANRFDQVKSEAAAVDSLSCSGERLEHTSRLSVQLQPPDDDSPTEAIQ